MHVRYLWPGGAETGDADDLVVWRGRREGYVWLHLDACDHMAATLLRDEFGFPSAGDRRVSPPHHLPTFHGYPDHWFVVVHRPLIGRAGHVHLLQLEQFVRCDALVTLHGPHNPDVDPAEVTRDTDALRARVDGGRLLPKTPSELSPRWSRESLARTVTRSGPSPAALPTSNTM